MVSTELVIKNPIGIHLRPAGTLCNEALKFHCKITFQVRNHTANAKSVLSVLGAGVKTGEKIILSCDGEDEEKALEALKTLIESGIGEEI